MSSVFIKQSSEKFTAQPLYERRRPLLLLLLRPARSDYGPAADAG